MLLFFWICMQLHLRTLQCIYFTTLTFKRKVLYKDLKIIAYIWQLTLIFTRHCKKGIKNIKWDSIFCDGISVVIRFEQTSPVTENATGRHAVPSRGSNIHLFYTFLTETCSKAKQKYRCPGFLFLQSCNYVIIEVLKHCLLSVK